MNSEMASWTAIENTGVVRNNQQKANFLSTFFEFQDKEIVS